jgi:hypothetical protein
LLLAPPRNLTTVAEKNAVDIMEQPADLLPEKLSIRQYLDEKLMPTLLPALNELSSEK